MDFVAEQLADGTKIRLLTIIDIYSREALAIVAGHSLRGKHVVAALSRIIAQRPAPKCLDVDLTTITRAYDEVRRRNLLEGRGARGTYVAAPKVVSTAILDLSMKTPGCVHTWSPTSILRSFPPTFCMSG